MSSDKGARHRTDTILSAGVGFRPEVLAFAHLMEAQLRANDHKPGWKGDDPAALLRRLHQEYVELFDAVDQNVPGFTAVKVGREAADVANFAMMVADVCGALPKPVSTPTIGILEADKIRQLVEALAFYRDSWGDDGMPMNILREDMGSIARKAIEVCHDLI